VRGTGAGVPPRCADGRGAGGPALCGGPAWYGNPCPADGPLECVCAGWREYGGAAHQEVTFPAGGAAFTRLRKAAACWLAVPCAKAC
jgi:hypothetical protein